MEDSHPNPTSRTITPPRPAPVERAATPRVETIDDFEPIHCRGTRNDGRPCQAIPEGLSWYCRAHNPETAAQQRAQSAAGGRAPRSIPIEAVQLDLSTRAGVQAAVEAVVQLEMTGRISLLRSRNILRALSIAARNFDYHRNRLGRIEPQVHDQDRMQAARRAIAANIAEIAEDTSQRDNLRAAALAYNSHSKTRREKSPASEPLAVLQSLLRAKH